jgi:hypothetical protein
MNDVFRFNFCHIFFIKNINSPNSVLGLIIYLILVQANNQVRNSACYNNNYC